MCGAAIAGAGGYGDPVSGYELHVAEEGGTLTKDQMIDNWALGGGDEPDWGIDTGRNKPFGQIGSFYKSILYQDRRKKWYDNKKSEWQTYYDNIGKDSTPSLDIPDKQPRKDIFYDSSNPNEVWKD